MYKASLVILSIASVKSLKWSEGSRSLRKDPEEEHFKSRSTKNLTRKTKEKDKDKRRQYHGNQAKRGW